MNSVLNGSIENLKMEILESRDEWTRVRDLKLKRKEELLDSGLDKKEVRKDRLFKELKKQQYGISKVIRHKQKRLNRKLAGLDSE